MKTMVNVIKISTASTLRQLLQELKQTTNLLNQQTNSSVSSIKSGCDLFFTFITLAKFDNFSFEKCRETLLERGEIFVQRTMTGRQRIADNSQQFIGDRNLILTHSYSRVVLDLLSWASKSKRFQVFVTESEPDRSGVKMRDALESLGIPSSCVLDASVASLMEKMTFVLVGAEAVVESGGIINKIGTFNIAIAAREMNKPFYVAAESFKFVRQYPLNNRDLVQLLDSEKKNVQREHLLVDYTPPAYITLLFTDIGPLTPSAVSDELIKLYT